MVKVTADNAVQACSDQVIARSESPVTPWLEDFLWHFGIHEWGVHELETISDHTLVALLSRRCQDFGQDLDYSALKPRLMALAGAQLDAAFLAMVPDVIEEEETETISLSVDSQRLQGVRYQGEVYRLVEQFEPCHRLQAFCLGHTLSEQLTAHLITRSPARFAVWVNVQALAELGC